MHKFPPTKRAAVVSQGPAASKARGPLSAMSTQVAWTPKAKATAKSKPANAPIVLAVYKYTSEASDLVPNFRPNEPLWAVRVEHNAYPNVESSTIAATNAFLADMKASDNDMPQNLQELRKQEQIIVQIGRADSFNTDGMPIKEFSLAYYIGGTTSDLRNAIHLLVEFFYHRCTHSIPSVDKSPWPVAADIAVHIYPRMGVDLETLDADITRMSVTLHPPALVLPLSLWSTNPPGSSRALMVEVEIIDEDTAIFAWDGRTYGFRSRFEQVGIPRVDANLRVLPEGMRSFTVDANRQRILDIFGNLVLRDLVCCVRLTGAALTDDGAVAALLAELREKPQMFFDAF